MFGYSTKDELRQIDIEINDAEEIGKTTLARAIINTKNAQLSDYAKNVVRFLDESDEKEQLFRSIMRDAVHSAQGHWEQVSLHLQTAITSREAYIELLEGISLEDMVSYEREIFERWRNSEVSRMRQAIRSMSVDEARWRSEYERLQKEVTHFNF